MLPPKNRLNLKKSYTWVRSGVKLETEVARIFYRLGDNQIPRIGITSSSSIFPKAHDRNRARRLLATGFATILEKLPVGINLVALPTPKVLDLSTAQISRKLKDVLNQISTNPGN